MLPSVKVAQHALLIKQSRQGLLEELSPLATNVLTFADDVTAELEDEEEGSYGALVPVWQTMDAVDHLITVLETSSDHTVPDSEADPEKDSLDETVAALVDYLQKIAAWTDSKIGSAEKTDDAELIEAFKGVRDSAFNASMGLADVFLSEGEAPPTNELLISEMRKLSGVLENDRSDLSDISGVEDIIASLKRLAGILETNPKGR